MIRTVLLLTMAIASISSHWGYAAFAAGTPSTITCSRVIIPACGTVNGVQQSFHNACAAHQAGAEGVVAGNCKQQPKHVVCAAEYAPVCAIKGGRETTYPNACKAEGDGAKVWTVGHCDNN
jgi:hypothetical protein